MKPLHYALAAILPVLPASAAIIADFDSASEGDLFTDLPGWTQSHPNPTFEGNPVPLAEVANAPGFNGGAGSLAGSLGTLKGNNPLSATTTLGTSLGVNLVDFRTVSLNLAIVDDAGDGFPVRDAFGINVTAEGGGSLATVLFSPTDGNSATWDISYAVNGGASVPTAFAIPAGAEYDFSLSFAAGTFELSFAPAGGGAASSTSGAVTYGPADLLGDIELFHTQNEFGTPGQSANTLLFDNIEVTVIPEPSVALIACTGVLGLLRRRRLA